MLTKIDMTVMTRGIKVVLLCILILCSSQLAIGQNLVISVNPPVHEYGVTFKVRIESYNASIVSWPIDYIQKRTYNTQTGTWSNWVNESFNTAYDGVNYYTNTSISQRTQIRAYDPGQGGGVYSNVIDVDNVDRATNWVKSEVFDNSGNVIASSSKFFNESGKLVQQQSRNFVKGKILISQPIYDNYGRLAANSLTAPSENASFGYDRGFMTNSSNETFDASDLPENGVAGNLKNSLKGTLGYYYSNNNSNEPYVPSDTRPFSRTEFYNDGSGEVKSATLPGSYFHANGKKSFTKTFPVMNDLNVYMQIREALVGDGATTLKKAAIKNVTRDVNNLESIVYTDENNHVLVSASAYVSGGAQFNMDASNFVWSSVASTFDFYLPYGATQSVTISGSSSVSIENLLTGQIFNSTAAGVFQGSLSAGFYRCHDCYSYDPSYNRYYNAAFDFYDNMGRLVASVSPKGVQEILDSNGNLKSGIDVHDMPFTNYFYYDYQGRLVKKSEPDAGETNYMYRKDGSIRFSQNDKQKTSGYFSYTNYDRLGRPVESGEYVGTSFTFGSNSLNAILESTSEGGGLLTQYSDRRDWVRTYYDLKDAQPGSTLEYNQNDANLYLFNTSQSTVIAGNSVTLHPGFSVTATSTVSFHAAIGTPSVPIPNIILPGVQEFTIGAVSYTENENSKTWYSYDELGRVKWMATWYKKIFTQPKKVEYEYDFQGNVTYVKFQDGSSDAFYHRYVYDANNALSKVYASTTGISASSPPVSALQATYEYYTHGPLKRVDLANGLEDVEYFYTLQGWLKSINNPNMTGSVFAQTNGYYNGDYSRSGISLPNISPAVSLYNGMITATQHRTDYNGTVTARTMHYRYDNQYQLIQSDNNSNESYKVDNIVYDANGNIMSIRRKMSDQTNLHDLSYYYNATKNQLLSVSDAGSENYNVIYTYNAKGELNTMRRQSDPEQTFTYDVTGKVKTISAGELQYGYEYNDSGFRIRKVMNATPANDDVVYVRDGNGQILAVYKQNSDGSFSAEEHTVYGSNRLGIYDHAASQYQYELKDQLGNVRSVITKVSGSLSAIAQSDYYPFGLKINIGPTANYRYGYQGEFADEDDETGFNHFEAREYDPVIGRWMVMDPARQFASGYVGMGNNPISGLDPDGRFLWFGSRNEADRAASNINGIFKDKFGINNAVSVRKNEFEKPVADGFWDWITGQKSGTETITEYRIEANGDWDISGLSAENKFVVISFADVLISGANVKGAIVDPNTRTDSPFTVGQLSGKTFSRNFFAVPNSLPDYNTKKSNLNIGSQILHEVLYHISPAGQALHDSMGDKASNWLYLRTGGTSAHQHPAQGTSSNINPYIPKRSLGF